MRRFFALLLVAGLAGCGGEPRPVVEAAAPAAIAGPAGDPLETAMDRGRQRITLGDNEGAERAFREAVALLEARHGEDAPEIAQALLQLALSISLQRRVGEAEGLFVRADRLVPRSGDGLLPPRLASYRAVHLATQGDLEGALTQARAGNAARRDLLQAEAARRAPVDALVPILAELAHGLLVEGSIALRLGRLDAAELAAHLARRILVDMGDTPEWWIADADELVGLVEAERRRFDEARERLGVAVATRLSVFGERRPVALGLMSLGRLNLRAGDAAAAVTDMRRGVEMLRGDDAANATLSFSRLNDFLTIADVARRERPSEAAALGDDMFRTSQMTWRSATSRTVSATVARLAASDDGSGRMIREWQQAALQRDELRLALGREVAKASDLRDPVRLDALRGAAIAAARTAQEAGARLGAQDRRWASLIDADPVAIAEAGGLLRADEALLSYVVGPEGAWGFLVRPQGFLAARLEGDAATLAARIGKLRTTLAAGPTGTVPAFDLAEAQALHRILIGPFETVLDQVRHLLLVSDGPLQSLPFGILAGAGGRADYAGVRWLGQRHAISVMPSVRSFADLRRLGRPSVAPSPFLGIGAPTLRGTAAGMTALERWCRDDAPVPPAVLAALAPLPDSADELQRVRTALQAAPGSVLTGPAATERAVRNAALGQHRVLYFATHALLPGELICQSEPGLVLTPGDGTATDGDGLLTASEIARLELDADLVVLSACNTAGPSGEFGGEALSGLTRAFFHAGARSLLVTHWPVESRATTDLMTGAFADSVRTDGLAERIRRAQARLLADPATAHPFFWGAFALIGDGRMGATAVAAARP